jgi:predicted SprT family Zn-dependent metalloprotease
VAVAPDLQLIWDQLSIRYFPDSHILKKYRIVWSNRKQTSCLGSCNIQTNVVRIASAMKQPSAHKYLEPLIYHEMCHAIVGIKIKNGRRKIHTREFKQLEKKHPGIIELDRWIKRGGWQRAVREDRLFNLIKKI